MSTIHLMQNQQGILSKGGSTLLNDLVSWWSLDETSGTRVDSHGSYNLTDNNTVGYVTGKVGNAAHIIRANAETLTNAPYTPLNHNQDWTMAMWLYPTAVTGDFCFLNWATNATAGGTNINLGIYNSQFYINPPNGGSWSASFITGTVSINTWYCFIVTFDFSELKFSVYVNNGTPQEITKAGVNNVASPTLKIGQYNTASWNYDGYIDELAIASRVWTADECTTYYNGIGYPG